MPEGFVCEAKAEFEFEAAEVCYKYERVAAVQGLSMQVRGGERIALLGANGSGKSTLLRLMDALHFASQGTMRFRGAALTEDAMENDAFALQFRRRVGLVFKTPTFNSSIPRCLTK